MMNLRIVLYQSELTAHIPVNDLMKIRELKPDILCLPEYFYHPELMSFENSISDMKRISESLETILVGGTTVTPVGDNAYNTCYIFTRGHELGHYNKVHLFAPEVGRITPGDKYGIVELSGLRIGILICADVLYQEAWDAMEKLEPDIIFSPTFSPYKEEIPEVKFKRDEEIYVRGARQCDCPIVKVCGIGNFIAHIQGRSLVATPEGILWRAMPEEEEKKIIKEVDLVI